MGTVIRLSTRSPKPADALPHLTQIDEILIGLGAITNGIVTMENESEALVRCIDALQECLEIFEGLDGMAADSGDHEQFLRETKLINSKLQSELTKLVSILRATQLAAEQVRRVD